MKNSKSNLTQKHPNRHFDILLPQLTKARIASGIYNVTLFFKCIKRRPESNTLTLFIPEIGSGS